MERKDDTSIDVKIFAPLVGYKKTMTFNRFSVEKLDSFVILHFGLLDKRDLLSDLYSCSVANDDLEKYKNNQIGFLQKIGGAPTTSIEDWVAPLERRSIDLVRFIYMSASGSTGEIILCSFAVCGLFANTKPGTKTFDLQPDPIAMLGCSTDLLKHFITKVYLD
jgi:hypothetical protein